MYDFHWPTFYKNNNNIVCTHVFIPYISAVRNSQVPYVILKILYECNFALQCGGGLHLTVALTHDNKSKIVIYNYLKGFAANTRKNTRI